MYYILNCRFDVHNNYLYQEEIDRETEKCYITKANVRIFKKKFNQVIIHTTQGVGWCEIYVATYSKPEDIQAGIEEINRIRTEFFNKMANQKVTIKDIDND